MIISGGAVSGSGTLTFNVNGSVSDQIDMSGGTLNLSALKLAVNETGAGANQAVYVLIDAVDGGSYTGTFASETIPAGYSVNYNYNGLGTQVALVGSASSPYAIWAGAGVLFDGDKNGDGVANGLAFLLGAANPDANALDLLPAATRDGGGGLVLTFSMLNAASRGTATLSVEHSSDLGIADAWVPALVPGAPFSGSVGTVNFEVTAGAGNLNDVVATIPLTEAAGGKLFGRLAGTEN
jgi:hypothetical protein